ncbi:hypothetical protein LT875_002439 [Salmonella enterica]|nr:hypothetical protein [Salmonella enterica]
MRDAQIGRVFNNLGMLIMCKAEKHFAGVCSHDEIMQLLKYRNKSDGYLKRIDKDFPQSLSRPPTQRKKHYYALKDVYPYVDNINAVYEEKERVKTETARKAVEQFRAGQPRAVLMKLTRIAAVHEDFSELERMLKTLHLPVRHRSKHRDACINAINSYMRRHSVQGRLRVVQMILNWVDHEELLRQQARL